MTKIIIVNNSETDVVKLRLKETADSAVDVGLQSGAVHYNSPYLDIGLKERSAACEPNQLILTEGKLAAATTVHLDYEIEAKRHGVTTIRERFNFTVADNEVSYSAAIDRLVNNIVSDHPFITFEKTTGSGIANFRYWTYSSDLSDEFRFDGASDALSSDPITIKFIKSDEPGDFFPMLFPNDLEAQDKIVHSCGTQEFIGI